MPMAVFLPRYSKICSRAFTILKPANKGTARTSVFFCALNLYRPNYGGSGGAVLGLAGFYFVCRYCEPRLGCHHMRDSQLLWQRS